jgi:ribulose-5-phosphate 4-epimerase/fuculose-1-phosphate aldolase
MMMLGKIPLRFAHHVARFNGHPPTMTVMPALPLPDAASHNSPNSPNAPDISHGLASLPPRPLVVREIPLVCNHLAQKGFVAGAAGNISVRVPGTPWIWTTATGQRLDQVTLESLVPLPLEGPPSTNEWPEGRPYGLQPTSEWPFHQRLYQVRPDIGAIVHAHPPKATALALAGLPLTEPLMAEVVFYLGTIPVVPYHLPGSSALAEAVASTMANAKAALLHHHGVITVGQTLQDALNAMELVEAYAEIYLNTRHLRAQGVSVTPFTAAEVAAIEATR